MTRKIRHGEIWTADLSANNGTEPGKIRPVLVIQSQALLNSKHPSTIVIPLTTKLVDDAEPLRLRVLAHAKLVKDSDLMLDQIRALDNKRFLQGPLAKCDVNFMQKVYQAIKEIMDIDAASCYSLFINDESESISYFSNPADR
jgi:mRNA interferase MazF